MTKIAHALFLAALTGSIAAPSWAYDYDEADPTQGAGAEAPWRSEAMLS